MLTSLFSLFNVTDEVVLQVLTLRISSLSGSMLTLAFCVPTFYTNYNTFLL